MMRPGKRSGLVRGLGTENKLFRDHESSWFATSVRNSIRMGHGEVMRLSIRGLSEGSLRVALDSETVR